MKTVHEKKLKEILERYVDDEAARDGIFSVVDDIVDDERYDAKNDGVAEEMNRNDPSIYY